MSTHARRILAIAIALTIGSSAFAQNIFTYQGRLENGGSPVSGNADMIFSLWTLSAGGAQVGGDHAIANVPVSDGLFTVLLNNLNQFGAAPFNGAARWLEIEVRSPAGVGGYTTLSRQLLSATPYASFAHAPWLTSGSSVYYNAGNVGIGTSTPAARLQVAGDALVDTGFGSLRIYHVASAAGWQFTTTAGGSTLLLRSQPGDATRMAFTSVGDVGIGTQTPAARLDVRGNFQAVGTGLFTSTLDVNGVFNAGSTLNVTGNINAAADAVFQPGNGIFANNGELVIGGANVQISLGDSSADIINVPCDMNFTSDSVSLTFSAADASNSPMIHMFASGTTNGDRMVLAHSPGAANWGLQYADAGDEFHFLGGGLDRLTINLGSGFIGIGTEDPEYRLHVAAGTDAESTGGGYLVCGTTTSANVAIDNNEIMARSNGATSTLFINNDGGNVVIAPGATTSVGIIEINGADLAERFPASEALEPGTVVAIDPQNPGHLCKARGAYNKRVAGVVSGAGNLPVGAVLGNLPESNDGPPIALSGRVWVKCDASSMAIEPGDLLTTSDTPGMAMKADDHVRTQGATLGKAMTALGHGESGLVLVLVSLQ